jgi:hypothetical protein
MNLRTLSYQDAERSLADKSDADLIAVMAGASRKLGATAAEMLGRRKRHDLVLRALREQRIPRRDGKVRALNSLLRHGRRIPDALPIYRQYATDKSADVVSTALFGIVFWQDRDSISFLESLLGGRHSERIEQALSALKTKDPKKYSPGFFDAQSVWKEEAHQAPQRNAGSRPSSDDPSASETPSSLGPRG